MTKVSEKNRNAGRSRFLSSGLPVIFFIYLITSAPRHFRNAWEKLGVLRCLLLTVAGLFFASKQVSRSTDGVPG